MGIKNIIGELRVNGKPVLTEKYSEGLTYASNNDGTCSVSHIGTCTDTDIIIPSVSPAGDRVTSIHDNAFYSCSNLTSVVIPGSVVSIGIGAFSGCSNLISVVIPDSILGFGEGAFSGCSDLKSIVIPDDVTGINMGTFSGCSSLTSVVIPDSVISIGDGAFSSCSGLTFVVIGDGVTYIGEGVFFGCSSLVDVYYPGSETGWNNISINESNEKLTNATIHYNYADDFMSINDRLGDVSSALDLLITQTNNILGGIE